MAYATGLVKLSVGDAVDPHSTCESRALMRTTRESPIAAPRTERNTSVIPESVLACAYARIIHGFILDCGPGYRDYPINILELHANSGRFAYQLMNRLAARLSPSATLDSKCGFQYIMTSARAALIERWRLHPWLAPLAARDIVTFVQLDDIRRDDLAARLGGAPLVIISNRGSSDKEPAGGRSFAVAPGGLATSPRVSWLQRMRASAGDCLLLAAERGRYTGREEPAGHQSLKDYARRYGGVALRAPQPAARLSVAGFLFRHTRPVNDLTSRAFADAIAGFGPDDWLVLQPSLAASLASTEQVLAYIRLSSWDHRALSLCLPRLLDRASHGRMSAAERLAILQLVRQVWHGFFPETIAARANAGGEPDMAFAIGVLLFGLEWCREAIEFFEHSIRMCGDSAAVRYNQALCALQLKECKRAVTFLDQALSQAPSFRAARALRTQLTGDVGASTTSAERGRGDDDDR